jgi:hypothetical protein
LQDAFQEQISASDKELLWAYALILKLPTVWVHVWSTQLMKVESAKVNENYIKIDKDADSASYD